MSNLASRLPPFCSTCSFTKSRMASSRFRSRTLTRRVAPKCGITVAPGWLWKNRIISGIQSSRKSFSRMNREVRERTRWQWKARSRAKICPGRSDRSGCTGSIHGRVKQLDGISDNLPNAGEMIFRGEHVSEPKPHDRSTAQFRLHQIRFAARVDGFDQLCVTPIGFRILCGFETKADHAHHG